MNDEKKKLGKAGCFIAIGTVVLMFAGMMMVCYSFKLDMVETLLFPGIIVMMLPIIAILVMAMLPQKLRGVTAVPRKERAVQLLMLLFVIMFFTGFLALLFMAMTSPEENDDNMTAMIISGSMAAIGFVGAIIMPFVNKHITGSSAITVHLLPEAEKSDEITEKVLDKVLRPENRLSAEERERELQRIEEQDKQAGVVTMTKKQVEEYENKKHLF